MMAVTMTIYYREKKVKCGVCGVLKKKIQMFKIKNIGLFSKLHCVMKV